MNHNIIFTGILAVGLGTYFIVDGSSTITGPASVIDGDTITVSLQRIRLVGIDAPEANQLCGSPSGSWPCGQAATAKMQEMVRRDPQVSCVPQTKDRYGRTIATCFNSEGDLGRRLVAQGLAVAYRRYSTAYVDEENAARQEKFGVWCDQCSFEEPEIWRRAHKTR